MAYVITALIAFAAGVVLTIWASKKGLINIKY